ncbi:hypothetical protein RND71_043751 [Anisodus tanguticus]|uniref:Glucose-methanol-choline oxidoreductase N-terminal domain-containing protein n=1 Tax=Anisodus tanguticus TaxID=243964 RepID=A0AAE1UTJ4_9SOLA|nr:hypothetical protein RND71_043751 [Anisodus tanguticus]
MYEYSVLLLEAGGSESLLSDIPIVAATLQMTPIDWAYQSEPQQQACFGLINRRSRWPRGRVLGGSSVLNYMLYVRGNSRDYNNWHNLGNPGWNWRNVLPLFIKSEDNQGTDNLAPGYHGTGGYLTVNTPQDLSLVGQVFTKAGEYLGYSTLDYNGPIQAGFSVPQGTTRDGARCSTSKAFLRPARERPNLHVLTFSYATQVLFNKDRKAVAVKFDRFGLTHIVHARQEIILSGGSINTAQLLMLSGIGPADHLNSLGIPVIANLPVGHNLQDHIYTGIHFLVNDGTTLHQRKIANIPNILKYFGSGSGPFTSLGGVEGLGFIKTKFTNYTDDYPDFEIHMVSGSPASDDGQTFRKVQGFTREFWTQYYQPKLKYETFSMYPVMLRPKSKGYIELRSADPYEPPIIEPQYLTEDQDIKSMVEAMKISIALGLTPVYRELGSQLFDTQMPGCEQYVLWSDEYLACHARTYTATLYHPVGTARMGPRDDRRSVVDPRLNVIGVKNLRIADGSIMPEIVSGNTNAPIIMIGEKCAMLIKEDIGYKEDSMNNFFNGANGLDSEGFDMLFDDAASNQNLRSGNTDFDFVNRILEEAIEVGSQKKR